MVVDVNDVVAEELGWLRAEAGLLVGAGGREDAVAVRHRAGR